MARASNRAVAPIAAFDRAFEQARPRLPGQRVAALARLREDGFQRFRDLGVPTQRAELWKYTNVAKQVNRELAVPPLEYETTGDKIVRYCLGGPKARRLIFVNGRLWHQVSHAGGLPQGVAIESLAQAMERRGDAVAAAFAELGDDDGRSFTALNTAFAQDGAWIELADGTALDQPLQLLFLTEPAETAFMVHPRVVIRLGKGARLHVIETHVALGHGSLLTNLVQQIDVAEGAKLVHDRANLVRSGTTQIGKASLAIGAGARVDRTVATLGGTLVRDEIEAKLNGPKVEAIFSGLAMPRGEEHVDALLRIHHLAPDCHSDQFYKNVVDDKAHAVFAGKIFVDQVAQKTNAYQKNDNLLLSDHGEVDTKPELEIYADDVKCSHGATCGDLDERELFYLRSRGIGLAQARSIMTYAFAGEVVERFVDDSLRRQVRDAILARLPGGEALARLRVDEDSAELA